MLVVRVSEIGFDGLGTDADGTGSCPFGQIGYWISFDVYCSQTTKLLNPVREYYMSTTLLVGVAGGGYK